MKNLLISLALVALSGCTTMELDAKWAPLKYIKQSKVLALGTGARTLNDSMYVSNLDDYIDSHPEPLLGGVLTHERVHALRQEAYPGGWGRYVGRYVSDRDFMWHEETLAYYQHIRYLSARGVRIVPESWARNISGYVGLYGYMVSYEDALAWLRKVLNGTWHPSQENP